MPEVHRMPGEGGPHAGAEDYEREMRTAFGEQIPRLDFLLLGLGPDAHVASLYPSADTLDERDRPAVGVEEAGWKPYVPRVSLTLPVLCGARRIVFLVAGEDKAEAVERCVRRRGRAEPRRAGQPRPAGGRRRADRVTRRGGREPYPPLRSQVAGVGFGPSPFPPIADYAFLSDCEATCLVAPSGNVEWMCLPADGRADRVRRDARPRRRRLPARTRPT